jgi:hypothetical protein
LLARFWADHGGVYDKIGVYNATGGKKVIDAFFSLEIGILYQK